MSENPAKLVGEMEPSAPDSSPRRAIHDCQVFGHIRNIRAASQYLQGSIEDALQQSAALPAAQRQDYIKGILRDPLLHRVNEKIDKQLTAIEDIFSADAGELEWGSDEVTTIELIWARVKESLASQIALTDSAEQHLKPVQNDLDRIVFYCESLTLSPRINDILANLRVGQPLDIDFVFSDEFPQSALLRRRLVDELAQQSFVLNGGVVDADQGVIYKTALTRWGQLMSLWRLLAALLLGFLLPYALAFGGIVFSGWPFQPVNLDALLANYVMIVLGSGAHLAVESLKAAKKQTRPSFHALHDWVLWVHVRQSGIFKGIAYIWTGYLLLSFGFRDMNWSLAFFAGYSIDSVTELFLGRFEATVAAETKLLTKV